MLNRLHETSPHHDVVYRSIDEITGYNSSTPSEMPLHVLHSKEGAIAMLLRDLDITNGYETESRNFRRIRRRLQIYSRSPKR